jgi:NDP-sugar pyrophosphorylase family protein
MKAGIIAAGTGRRLAQRGFSVPKPLITVGGEPMIARAIRAAALLKTSSVACIVNDLNPAVSVYLRSRSWPIPLELVVKTTPSSMESLLSLAPLLQEEPFVLFTVDAIFPFEVLEGFLERARSIRKAQGVLALTTFIDDENPLRVKLDARQKIVAMGHGAEGSAYATAGFYYFNPDIFSTAATARQKNLNSLRQFLGLLIEKGYPLYGIPVAKTVDVDHPEDIQKAEAYLKEIGEGCRV